MFKWENDLDIGVAPMNDDHKQLIQYMEELHRLTLARSTPAAIDAAIAKLAAYAKDHFDREESYMDSIQYPGAKQHKEVHKNLLSRFAYQQKEFVSAGYPADSKFFEFLNVWLMSHIKGIDTQYGKFATGNQAAS